MNSFEFYSRLNEYKKHSDYLEHHGIKGQKWGVRRYQNPDGSLTEEGKARYLNPDGSLNDKAPNKIRNAYNQYQYKKMQEDRASGKLYEDDYVYDKNKQAEKMNHAKTSRNFDMNFLEATQNADDMTDKERETEYAKYLKNPYKYMEEFDSNNWRKSQTKMGSTKSKSTKGSSKPSKEEKKAIKEAKKETTKLLKGGSMAGNWDTLNKAMDDLGYTSAERKNLSSSDWDKINKQVLKYKQRRRNIRDARKIAKRLFG